MVTLGRRIRFFLAVFSVDALVPVGIAKGTGVVRSRPDVDQETANVIGELLLRFG